MIRVTLAPEPDNFNYLVRSPGMDAIREMVGEAPLHKRPGRRRRKIADRREDIPPSNLPDFWTRAIDDLLNSYGRVCAYVSFYIEPVTGVPTVDHMVPKSRRWDKVYEWSNYRLCCHLINSRKGDIGHFLDPFEVHDDWFGLEFIGFEIIMTQQAPAQLKESIDKTLDVLNQRPCRELRKAYANDYWNSEITLDYLNRRAPFVARELRRQERLRVEDM